MKIMFSKAVYKEMKKAFGKKDLSKLHQKVVTDKNGVRRKVWVSNEENPSNKKKGKTDTQNLSSKQHHNVTVGDVISFNVRDNFNGTRTLDNGRITAIGADGVTVQRQGVKYKVPHRDIVSKTKNSDGTIPADIFNANDYKKSFTDTRATNDDKGYNFIYDSLGETGKDAKTMTIRKLEEQSHRMKKGDTMTRNTDENGNWTPERDSMHEKIISEILSPEKIKACLPKNGEKPKFVMFGGRGGSGKSWFTGKKRATAEGREVMFDSDKFLVLDADALKEYIPEYEGWNAGEVHEESSYLNKEIKKRAFALGLNIIIDGTMNYNPKKPDKVKNEMLEAKSKGYSLEAHYMFLPVQESAKRAINRFKTKKGDFSGRLVPMDILMSMQDNEKSFDSVKDIVDDWSFRDNQGDNGPKLVSRKAKDVKNQ